MSSFEEKFSRPDLRVPQEHEVARCWLKKHLTYKDKQPKYTIIESDKLGPKRVEVVSMERTYTWRRVSTSDGDFLMELEGSAELESTPSAGSF